MNAKHVMKNILSVTSTILILMFFVMGALCVMHNYFYGLFVHLFRFMDSIGITTTVIILMSGGSLIGGLLTYWLYVKI